MIKRKMKKLKLKLTLYPFYNFIYSILFIQSIFGFILHTELGKCEINIFDTDHNIEMIERTVIDYSEQVNMKFGRINPKPYKIYITKDRNDFYKKSRGPVPEWGIAIAKKNPNLIVMQSPNTARISFNKFIRVLIHELNHIYLYNVSNSHSFPSWFKEGMAVSESKEFSINDRILISAAKWKQQLFDIDELQNFNKVNRHSSQLAYAQSYAMFTALQFYYGNDIYKNIIREMNNDYDFWDALVIASNDSKSNIKNNLELFLIKKYNWMFLLNAYNLIFVFLPLILIGGYIYKKYKNKKLLRKWEIEELLEDLNDDEPN